MTYSTTSNSIVDSSSIAGWVAALCGLCVLVSACEDTMVCTADIRTAVVVYVVAPDGREVDSVTATNSREAVCRDGYGLPTSEVTRYDCWEQGAGSYEVRVTSGERTWTKEATVAANGCHVQVGSELFFELTDESAD